MPRRRPFVPDHLRPWKRGGLVPQRHLDQMAPSFCRSHERPFTPGLEEWVYGVRYHVGGREQKTKWFVHRGRADWYADRIASAFEEFGPLERMESSYHQERVSFELPPDEEPYRSRVNPRRKSAPPAR